MTMSDTTSTEQLRQREGDQKLPHAGTDDVGQKVIASIRNLGDVLDLPKSFIQEIQSDFEARIQLGVQRYGHRLETFNGRDALLDQYQELLDATQYAKQVCLETPGAGPHARYWALMRMVFDTKEALTKRGASK
jgi:hypothetical protein